MDRPWMRVPTITLDAPRAVELARFYQRLLGYEMVVDEGDWVMLKDPAGGVGLSFQSEEHFTAPVWPATPGAQSMMMHLEVEVRDLAAATEWALECGARLAGYQPQQDVRVCLDPVGHPFCLFTG
ncbi:hypothetical protein LX16_1603 [Stackebrandtia albiflava]|uniref:Glyoxalase-like domain-containing protein n=1 Tax=Stackebrandtia albiflava TaxID=406432 RepID=A0A562VDC9_9ACTN|nr:VOC family protein [Stackebrandtia albiflava]TWJ15884.1 hypothetical protein LX16_1603 [Stackebrandtia albiflava]